MKTIYLKYVNCNWKFYQYENIHDLKDELYKRQISIGDPVIIGNDVIIGKDAKIASDAIIGDEVKLITGIYINGSKHTITYTGNGTISIGCHNYTIGFWKDNYIQIGKNEGYSTKEIEEYYQYILIVEQFHNTFYSN